MISYFDPCGMILFEIKDTGMIESSTYDLAAQWQIGDSVLFSLYLQPAYLERELEMFAQ